MLTTFRCVNLSSKEMKIMSADRISGIVHKLWKKTMISTPKAKFTFQFIINPSPPLFKHICDLLKVIEFYKLTY